VVRKPMENNITVIVLLSAILHPLWNAMIKRDNCPEGAFVGNGTMLVFLAGAHSLIAGHDLLTIAKIWHLLIITVLAKLIYTVSLVTMLRWGDLSAYYPIARSSPAFIVLISALFLGVLYTPLVLAGISMVLAGAFWLQYKRGGRLLNNPLTLAFALLAMVGTGVNSIADALAVQVVAPSVIFFWTFIFTLPGFVLFFIFFGGEKVKTHSLFSWVRNPLPYIKIGVICYASYFLILLAYQGGGEVAVVNSVRQASIPISVLLGGVWLKEIGMKQRILASLLLSLGIVIIVLSR
jgi:drug/metabolite transporter (DMT)-like permease